MTTFSIWTFYNANKGGRLNMLLPVPLKKKKICFRVTESEVVMDAGKCSMADGILQLVHKGNICVIISGRKFEKYFIIFLK